MQVLVGIAPMACSASMMRRSSSATDGSWPSSAPCSGSLLRGSSVSGATTRAPSLAHRSRKRTPGSPSASASQCTWALRTSTRHSAPKKRPISAW